MSHHFSGPVRFVRRLRSAVRNLCSACVRGSWAFVSRLGAIGPFDPAGRRFGRFGFGSIVCFPANTIMNERHIRIGEGTMIGPHVTLSAGTWPGQPGLNDTVLSIGDRCLIGRGSGIVAHTRVEIGNDVWTGHNVYITDQNHGYEDITVPISRQRCPPDRPVSIGEGSWLGFGVAVLPGSRIGKHVVIGANAVVTGEIPDYSVAVGAPARVVRRFVEGAGWIRVDPRGGDGVGCPADPRAMHR